MVVKKILWNVLRWIAFYCAGILLIQLCNPWIVAVAKFFQDSFNSDLLLNWTAWLFICLLVGIYCYTNRILNLKVVSLILAVYSTFRFYDKLHLEWAFMKYESIYYCDILVGAFFLSVLIDGIVKLFHLIRGRNKGGEKRDDDIDNQESKFAASYSESSITRKEDDRFRFYEEAKLFLDKLVEQKKTYKDNALIVGLEGEWGSGKSSFINMIECAISDYNKSSQFKLVKFSSWNYRNSNQLTVELLSVISESIGEKEIRKAIDKYIKVFEGTSLQWLAVLTKAFCGGDKTTQEYFNDVNEKLKFRNQTLIVAVDDIDRLVKEEVIEVLKLVRNTANFRNIVYVVAYDRSYVEEALKECGISNSEKYLEKIFNVPFLLPEKSIESKKELYNEILQKNIFFNKTDKTDNGIAAFVEEFGERISIRNIKKLAKQLLINTPFIREDGMTFELEIYDTLILYYLNIRYPKVYAHLSNIKGIIPKRNNSKYLVAYNGYNTVVLNTFVNPNNLANDNSISNDDYKEKRLSPFVEKSELEFVYRLLTALFCSERSRSAYSICHIDAYPIYFNRMIPDNCIKENEFVFQSKQDNFSQILSEWKKTTNRAILCNLIEYLNFSKYSVAEVKRVVNVIISEVATDKIYVDNPNLRILEDGKFRAIPGISCRYNKSGYKKVLLGILNNTKVDKTFMQRFSILLDSRVYRLYNSNDYVSLYRTYIENYLKTIHDYANFNPEVWCSLVYLYQNINDSHRVEEIQDIFKVHLLQYIISFHRVYFDKFSTLIKEHEQIKDSAFYKTFGRFAQMVFLSPSYSVDLDNVPADEWVKRLIVDLENKNNKIADLFSQHLKAHHSLYKVV